MICMEFQVTVNNVVFSQKTDHIIDDDHTIDCGEYAIFMTL